MEKKINRCPRSPDGRHYLIVSLKKGRVICECCGQEFNDIIIIERE
jgi:hypothetical protein